jgi:hypothetical protein
MRDIPMMPDEFKGATTTNGGYTKTSPRKWTDKEIEWVKRLMSEGYSNKEIAVSIGRSEVSTQIKIKRLGKKAASYNTEHIADKYQTNIDFISYLQPKSVLDVYSGEKSFYSDYCSVVSNDKNESFNTDYHLDSLDFCCLMYHKGTKVDLVDLDPFGSAYDCFDLAVKMAQKGLVITLGELGHKRWKRLDFVSRYYGIHRLEDFTLDNLIEHIQMIGLRNKKLLKVYAKREWRNIGRVWFEIEPYKITSQWEKIDIVGDSNA